MAKRYFEVEFNLGCFVELDDAVIDAVDDEWRSVFYDLYTPGEIAHHIAYNLLRNRAKLSHLDGWADQSDKNVDLLSEDWDLESVREVPGTEVLK